MSASLETDPEILRVLVSTQQGRCLYQRTLPAHPRLTLLRQAKLLNDWLQRKVTDFAVDQQGTLTIHVL